MARRARVSRGTRGLRVSRVGRKFVWARRLIIDASVPANSAVYSDLLTDFQTALGADIVGCTVVRIRGAINFGGTDLGIMGIRVMTQSTFDDLSGPEEGPAADPYADWLYYKPLMFAAGAGEYTRDEIDGQAARKMEELGQGLLLAVSNPTTDPLGFNMDLSIGLKLP